MDKLTSLLGGWSQIKEAAVTTTTTNNNNIGPCTKSSFDSLFTTLPSVNKLTVAIDCSGSVSYTQDKAHDNKNFTEIYVEAVRNLLSQLPTNNLSYVLWASLAKLLTNEEYEIVKKFIDSNLPFDLMTSAIEEYAMSQLLKAREQELESKPDSILKSDLTKQVINIGSGTNPASILPLIDNSTAVIITDGNIDSNQVLSIKNSIGNCSCGPIILVIIPHIHEYRNLYVKDVEMDALNSINITIPQAFSTKLATVMIWNYKTKSYFMVPELTSPWVNGAGDNIGAVTLGTLVSRDLPLVSGSCLISKVGPKFKTLNLEALDKYAKGCTNIMSLVNLMIEYKIPETIRQQANAQQKQLYNNICTYLFNKGTGEALANIKNIILNDDMTLLEKLKASCQYDKTRRDAENKFISEFGPLFNKITVDKTVGEVTSIGAAKTLQTKFNVNNFQKMEQKDKLAEMADVLPVDECSLCGTVDHVYFSFNFPTKFILGMMTSCVDERRSRNGKVERFLNCTNFKKLLDEHAPKVYCLRFCSSCAIRVTGQAKDSQDPEYGITRLIPQNIVNGTVHNRLLLLPLIDKNKITDTSNPNEPKLSFVRQVWRGIFSKMLSLNVAGMDVMNALLLYLTSIATEETAPIIYANQVSFLRGGSNDKYPDTIGRLFKVSVKPISSEVMTQITAISPVVEMCKIPIIPESKKLLLFCLLDRKIWPLISAKRHKDAAYEKFMQVVSDMKNGKVDNIMLSKFGLNNDAINKIMASESVDAWYQEPGSEGEQILMNSISLYLQDKGLNMGKLVFEEAKFKELMTSTNFDQMASSINIDKNYLTSTVGAMNLTFEQFKEKVVAFIGDLVNDCKDTSSVIMKYIL